MSPAKLVTSSVCAALFLTAPALSSAQTCTTDADCGPGLSCQPSDVATPPAAPCPAADADCRPADPAPAESKSCRAASCAADTDCGANMVCYAQPSTICSGEAPAPTTRCDPYGNCETTPVPAPEPATCTDTVVATCAFRHELPCHADAECGEGFTCQPTIVGTCTGSAGASGGSGTGAASGSGGAPAGDPVPPVTPDRDAGAAPSTTCTTTSTFPGRCLAKVIPCTAAMDCPATWTCVGGLTAVAPAPTGIDAGAEVPVVVTPNSPSPTSVCQPPTTRGGASVPTRGSDGQGTGTVGLGGSTGSGAPTSPTPTPTVPGNENAGAGDEKTSGAATAGGGGCNVGGGLASESSWFIGVLSALGLLLSRRRR